ncbi:Golgi apparatus protein 1-like [Physella acuta]|uniref:Golgi apparatus protein 1-like n=1 Tax=Physella acuta TaxID=109671 RepID=UPI0027DCB45D|nr:Golgi apparatus protein 1-like [Physella acuta]
MYWTVSLVVLCIVQNGAVAGPVGSTGEKLVPVDEKVKPKPVRIASAAECMDDVKKFCSDKANMNNFMVLDCLQNSELTAESLSTECNHYLWNFKMNLSKDIRFDQASDEACNSALTNVTECKKFNKGEGKIIPCLIEHYEQINFPTCKTFLNKMAAIIFSDYRFMDFFIHDCQNDIQVTKCGRLNEGQTPHSQGKTVSCLNEQRKLLSAGCKKALLRVAELQSDDFHLDRPLFYACRGDRESFCHDTVAGNGAVFKCLYKHLGEKSLSVECREKLEARQRLVAEDVKVDRSFYSACASEIEENKCHLINEVNDLQRSTVLLCLEKAQSLGKLMKPECLQEMLELRSELMNDYKISPELVSACQTEIESLCKNLEPGGNTITCLMRATLAAKHNLNIQVSSQCSAQIGALLHVANPGEDIRLDRPLQHACGDVVVKACKDRQAGQGDVITCLLENIDHEDMTDECEERLLEIQYFAVRDFRLDAHLFKHCQKDALTLCHSNGFTDPKTMEPEQGSLIFSCLHRHMRSNHPQDSKPSRACVHEVKRVMRERADRIHLLPEIETACIKELSEFCSESEHHEKNGEMTCLQEAYEDLGEACKSAVGNYTEEEMEDIELDRILMKACTPMIKKFCSDLLNSDAVPSDVLDCLIEHKNVVDMNDKCAAGIEHHQIISMKDFRFNHKFREACQFSVATFCSNRKTKYDVVACLSEHVRNDTLMERDQRIEAGCQRQLKFELLQRGESINLDPKLKEACKNDVKKLCKNKKEGEGETLECLKSHKKKLSKSCHKVVFDREKEEVVLGDYAVNHVCQRMIKKFCDGVTEEADIMNCLKSNLEDSGFDHRCRQIVLRRQIEQSQDFRLNPHLQKACRLDIPKYCATIYDGSNREEEMEGKVIDCLKKQFVKKSKSLSSDCEKEVQSIIKEEALDIGLNPVLFQECKDEIHSVCETEFASLQKNEETDEFSDEKGLVIECLKRNFQKLKTKGCQKAVAYSIAESRIDVHVDPLLHSTCLKDLIKHCHIVKQGQGRQMSCLLALLESDPDSLSRSCHEMLKRRKDLWEYAAQVAPPESFQEIVDQMTASPSRNYFFAILFTVIGVIFIVGLTCGRVTKRVRAELKNK